MPDRFIPFQSPSSAREKKNSYLTRYCGTEYALNVSNGTTGLYLALAALGLKPGDEAIIPDLTFVATADAIVYKSRNPSAGRYRS